MIQASKTTLTQLRKTGARGALVLLGASNHQPAPENRALRSLQALKRRISAGGPGSGCHGDNCGRPKSGTSGNFKANPVQRAQYPLTSKQRAAEAKFATAIARDPEKAMSEYTKRFGNVLNADNAKELSPEYQKDRTTMAAAVHEPASWLVKQMFTRALAEAPPEGKDNLVFFTAGGAGAGKTSSIQASPAVQNIAEHAQIVYDGTLRPAGKAVDRINQALAAGKNVMVAYTDRDPEQAFKNGVIPRALHPEQGGGRTVMIDEFANQHTSIRDSMNAVANQFADNPHFQMVAFDNSGGPGQAKQVNLSELPVQTHTKETLVPVLQSHLKGLYESGQISKKLYAATLGTGSTKEIGM